MKRFIARYAERISGVLSGFDRLIFRGTLRRFAYPDGLAKYLGSRGILLKDFAEFAHTATARVKTASELEASRAGRPVVYLESSRQNKESFSAVDTSERLGRIVHDVCQPTIWKGKRARALRPWTDGDAALLAAVARGEFNLRGFRNRELLALVGSQLSSDPLARRRASAKVTRRIRLLRAHGLVRKLGSSHRYVLTSKGHDIVPAILTAQRVSLQQLQRAAA